MESLSTLSLDTLTTKLIDLSVSLGSKLVIALIVFFIGRWLIKKINRLVVRIMEKRQVEASLFSFTRSLVSTHPELYFRYCPDWYFGNRNQFFHCPVCFCRCCRRHGFKRNPAKLCRRSDDSTV